MEKLLNYMSFMLKYIQNKRRNDMAWAEVLIIIGGNAAIFIPLFFWLRTEGNADRRDIAKIVFDLHQDIQKEMKDFHGRLCAIEERNKNK
jgi:arginase family enzyme